MKLKLLLVFNTVVALVFGVGFLLVPTTVAGLYGMSSNPVASLAAQFFGAALIGIGLICLLLRDVADPVSQRAIVLSQFVSTIIGAIVAVMGTTSGVMNAVGWTSAAIFLFLALGYGYFLFAKPSAS